MFYLFYMKTERSDFIFNPKSEIQNPKLIHCIILNMSCDLFI
ncbi:hypothetical protein D1AOALGA4SA_8003 [Olavius algarvensis Delta 1 endosymbiont]|nr:hypothetical protein D1AOALGA4SA_8003 [Olavius algarvensis Delta 1 endosymbiont]